MRRAEELRSQKKRSNESYPLRGEPYRYDLPYDPVAADEWEVRE